MSEMESNGLAVRARMQELEAELRRHTRLYYEAAAPEISDQAFDAMMRELRGLEEAHPEWASPDSPTKRVGGAASEGFAHVAHAVPMMSLDNTYSEAELREFDARVRKGLGLPDGDFPLRGRRPAGPGSVRIDQPLLSDPRIAGCLQRGAVRGLSAAPGRKPGSIG